MVITLSVWYTALRATTRLKITRINCTSKSPKYPSDCAGLTEFAQGSGEGVVAAAVEARSVLHLAAGAPILTRHAHALVDVCPQNRTSAARLSQYVEDVLCCQSCQILQATLFDAFVCVMSVFRLPNDNKDFYSSMSDHQSERSSRMVQ